MVGAPAKVVVGGRREGRISWDQIYHSAPPSHSPVITHRDDIMQVMTMVMVTMVLIVILYQIYFTSGTTGAPKMVGHTHSSYGFCHQAGSQYFILL